MTEQQKYEITSLVVDAKNKLGSMKRVATRTGVSEATISLIIAGKTKLMADKLWLKIGAELDWKRGDWEVISTNNAKMIWQVFEDAKEDGMWLAVSYPAGSGKSESCNTYESNKIPGTYVFRCWEYGKKEFMRELCRYLGITIPKGNFNANDLMRHVVAFFKQRISLKPLLIIDEVDKLRPGALRNLIPLYNELEGQLGVVVLGTENLKKEIKRGVGYSVKGYDEIDSRFGRRYVALVGATKKEVIEICKINGIVDKETSTNIFKECEPVPKMMNGRVVMVVEDLRRVKRATRREVKRMTQTAG